MLLCSLNCVLSVRKIGALGYWNGDLIAKDKETEAIQMEDKTL